MSTCRVCDTPCQLFLCRRHTDDLRDMLTALAHGPAVNGRPTQGLLADLADVALKRTRLGGGSGHRKRGDEQPAPWEPDTEQGRQTPQGRAETLLHAARTTLTTVLRDLCEHRGITPPDTVTLTSQASWLAHNVHAIACDEAAGQWWGEVEALVRQGERIVDRPEPARFCGPCTYYVEENRHCGTLLYTPRQRVEVTCPTCHTTHRVDRLTENLERRADALRFTSTEILVVMAAMGRPIPERTWRRWRAQARVKIRGWKRPDNDDGTRGSITLSCRSERDEPVYRLAEVRKVYATAIRHADADGMVAV